MNQLNFSRYMLATDLFICVVWLMLVLHVGSASYYTLLWTIPVFRIWLSFLTYRRSKIALMPLSFLVVFYLSTLQMHANPVFLLFNRPGLVLIKSVSALFCPGALTPDMFSDLWHGSWNYRYQIMAVASVWVVIIPSVVYVCRLVRKQLVPCQLGLWKRTCLFAYILCILIVMSVFVGKLRMSAISVTVLSLLLMLIPVIFNHGKISEFLTRTEQAFIVGFALLGMAYTCALSYNTLSSVMTMVMPVAIYSLVNWYMDRKVEYVDILLLVAGSVFFLLGQYVTDMFRIVLLLLSLGLFAVAIVRFAYTVKKYWQSIVLYLVVAVLVPIFSIGYNPYSVLEAGRVMHYDDYDDSPNGLMLVKGKEGYGIRDRYGLILPAEYDWIEHLIPSKPYCKVEKDRSWLIYDIVRHELLSEEQFTDVVPCGELAYRLESPNGDKYLLIPYRYSRFNDGCVAEITDQVPSERKDSRIMERWW